MKDEDNIYWVTIWRLVAVAASIAIVSLASCTAYKHSLVRDMVEKGTPPSQAYCAIHMGGSTSDAAFCSVVEMKK